MHDRRPVVLDLAILERYAVSWWDALIVAAAQSCASSVMLTGNLQHDQMLGDVRVIDPFAAPELTPEDVSATLPV